MQTARVTLDPAFSIGEPDRRLFGSFVEHMGRCVYGGIFEPGHPNADERGLRTDVLDLVRELGVTVVRYPGGNFVSGYRWEDGLGPPGDRPRRLDLAWRAIETNAFGINEFMAWARAAGVEPMLAVNLGTRGLQEACDLLEYCNIDGGTYLSDLRRKHGAEQPYGVRLWCLGNELDGPWQVGHKTADEYGRLAAQTAKAMKLVDPSVELVACGSSNSGMPTFASWEATVLEHTYEYVGYISLHTYYDPGETDRGSFLASAVDLDGFIDAVAATADHVAAKLRQKRRLQLSVDEWNVWYQSRLPQQLDRGWVEAPALIEDTFTAADAVVVGDLLITLLRHADRVGVACQAQLANVIGPIRTTTGGPAWRQTIFHPFALTARYATGTVLRTEPAGPAYVTQRYGEVPVLDMTALYDDDAGSVVIFAVNRGEQELELTADVRALPTLSPVEHVGLSAADDPLAVNTADDQERVTPRRLPAPRVSRASLTVVLPPMSWNAVRLTATPD